MPMSAERRRARGRLAAIERHHPDDPRLPELRAQLGRARLAEDLAGWVEQAAASLPPLVANEVQAVGHLAAAIDARLTTLLAAQGGPADGG
jgi:hypothetical protein